MNTQAELRCQIIPVETGNLLIPEQLVAEVVTLEGADSQKNLSWRNRVVPIVPNTDFNKLTTRVAIIKTIMGYEGMPFIAIPTDGIPHAVDINSSTLGEVLVENQNCSIAAGYGRVGSLNCVIIDLPKLESVMQKKSVQ
ncbi:MAG: hypothetical protein V3U84_06605 [Thiotrichaceae bacterium]